MNLKPNPTTLSLVKEVIEALRNIEGSLAGEFTVDHLAAAESWDDRFQCLKWAIESQATVAEMIVWHRAKNGLDLFAEEESTAPSKPVREWPKWSVPKEPMISGTIGGSKPIAYARQDSEYYGFTVHEDGSSFRYETNDGYSSEYLWRECTEAEALSRFNPAK